MKNEKDFFSGLLFAVVGSAFGWGALSYEVGSSGRMGPGYFPLLLGVLLALLGLVMMWRAARQPDQADPIGRWAWRPMVFIIAANLLFGVALGGLPSLNIPALGLMAGIYVLTFTACLAGENFSLRRAMVLGTVLALLSYLAFVLLLKLQFVVWPTVLAGS